jgi:hypothetical protein
MATKPKTAKLVGPDGKTLSSTRSGVGSGASIFSGQFTNALLMDPDELRTPERRHATYRVMSQTDSYIAEALRATIMPLIASAKWSVKVPKSKVKKSSELDAPAEDTGATKKPDPFAGDFPDPKKKAAFGPLLAPKLKPGEQPPWQKSPDGPAETEPGEKESKDQERMEEMVDLLEANLLGQECDEFGNDYCMQQTFSQLLREITMMLPHGFSVFHKQYKAVEGKLVYDRLLWLEPQTITRWEIGPGDKFLGITRQYRKADDTYTNNEFIAADELALFVWDITGTRLEGVPMLRSAFGPWKRKEFIERCKMIALQQSGVGIPVATWNPEGWGSLENIKQLEDRIEEVLQASLGSGLGTAYIAVPNDTFKATYLRQSGSDLNVFDDMTTQENLSETHAGGTKSMASGEATMGSRQASSVHRSLEYVITLAVAQIISEQMRKGIPGVKGLVEDLCSLNYADVKRYPEIAITDVDPDESVRKLPLVKDLMSAGAIKYRLSAEEEIWKRLGFELPDEEFDPTHPTNAPPEPPVMVGPDGLPLPTAPKLPGVPPTRTKLPSPSGPKGGAPRVAKETVQNRLEIRGNKLSDIGDSRRESLRLGVESLLRWPSGDPTDAAAKGYRRSPTEFEAQVCLLGQISSTLQNGGSAMAAQLSAARAAMIEDIRLRMEQGKVNRRNLPGLRRSRPKGIAPYQLRLKDRWMEVATLGRVQAEGELGRQKDIVLPDYAMAEDGEDSMWHQLPPGAAIPAGVVVPSWVMRVTASELQGAIEAEAILGVEIALDELWARMLDEAIDVFMRLSRTGIPEAEVMKQVESALQELSSKPEALVGRQLAEVAYNQGRDMAIKTAAASGEARYAMRSEVLDSATCASCAGLDGVLVLIGTPEYEQLLPPALCLGGDSCRGFYVLIADSLVKQGEAR